MLFGGIEAGGTKFVCAVADENLQIVKKMSFPTTEPKETLEKVFAFFDCFSCQAIGIGSFGPIGVNQQSEDYGHILATPKSDWQDFDFLGSLQKRYQVPMAWTTDVNAAAYAELNKGVAQGKASCLYLTIGTGIGGGFVTNEGVYQGVSHPEMGHIYVKRHKDDSYQGICPYHGDCLEGLAAGPSLVGRTGISGEKLPVNHFIWQLQSNYLAQALVNYTMVLAPEIIVLGGGVMNQDHLIEKIRQQFQTLMAGYMVTPPIDEYIVKWGLPNESGIFGALLLAQRKVKKSECL